MLDKTLNPIKPPIFCPTCRKPRQYVRQLSKDWIGQSGKIMEEYWECPVCGDHTLIPPSKE